MKWYVVCLTRPVCRSEYLVRASSFNEAARKALRTDTEGLKKAEHNAEVDSVAVHRGKVIG